MPHVTGPIWACPCGTIACAACYTQLGGAAAPCPTCTSPLGSSRNRGFERVRDKYQNQLLNKKRASAASLSTMGPGPGTFYHGTSIEAALAIQATGFDATRASTNAGALLGPGVYCTTTLEKAMDYAKGLRTRNPAGGIIFELQADLGRCKTLAAGDAMMKTWQQHGYDSAWAPLGANHRNLAENCINDPARITIVRAIPGDPSELKAMGMLVHPDGQLAMAGDQAAAVAGGSGGRKRKQEPPAVDADLWELLREWKLEDVADELANEGIKHVLVLVEELLEADVEQLPVGRIYKKRLCKLLAHLHAARQEQERLKNADIKQVLTRMRAEPVSAQVQREGCTELATLARDDPGKRTAIVAEGGIPVVLAAMKAHAGDAEMLVQGCSALTNLAANVDNRIAIAAAGGIPVVLAAMTAHKGHVDVQVGGCVALTNLAANNANNQTAIAAAGGIPVVLAAIKAHAEHASVQEQGCWALSNIGGSDATLQKRIKDEGGVDVVQAAMAASGATTRCKQEGQKLLGKLAQV